MAGIRRRVPAIFFIPAVPRPPVLHPLRNASRTGRLAAHPPGNASCGLRSFAESLPAPCSGGTPCLLPFGASAPVFLRMEGCDVPSARPHFRRQHQGVRQASPTPPLFILRPPCGVAAAHTQRNKRGSAPWCGAPHVGLSFFLVSCRGLRRVERGVAKRRMSCDDASQRSARRLPQGRRQSERPPSQRSTCPVM